MKKSTRKYSLGYKVALLFTIICVCMVIIQNIVAGFIAYRSANHQMNNLLSEVNITIDEELDLFFGAVEKVFRDFAHLKISEIEELEDDLSVVMQIEYLTQFTFARSDSMYYSFEEMPSHYEPSSTSWFQTAKTENEYFYTAPFVDTASNDNHVSLVKRVQDDVNGLKQVMSVNINVEAPDIKVIFDQNNFEFLNIFVFNSSLNVAVSTIDVEGVHSLPSLFDLKMELPKIEEVASSKTGIIRKRIDGELYTISIHKNEMTGYYVLTALNQGTYLTKLFYTIVKNILWSFLQILAGIAVNIFIILNVFSAFKKTVKTMQDLAEGEGDLTVKLPEKSKDEIGLLAKRVNSFISKLHGMISEIVVMGKSISDKALKFSQISNDSKEKLVKQQGDISLIAAAVHQMSATAQEVANNAEQTAIATTESSKHCDEGREVIASNKESIMSLSNQVQETSEVINELKSNTRNITTILSTIQDISKQTNLLALNAAIEAARAGDQGRGFAVVADEVRVLSQKTHGSTEEIKTMIDSLQLNTESAVHTMTQSLLLADDSVEEANNATEALNKITESINKIANMSTQIASAASEQRSVTNEVSRNIEDVTRSSGDIESAADQMIEMTKGLTHISEKLAEVVGKFKL